MTGGKQGSDPAPFARHLLSLADTKRILGIRYSDWLLGAPSIETGIAASAMAQDEWGHARLLYSMLKDFGFDPFEIEHERPAARYYSAPALDQPLEDWAGVVAAVAVVDRALEVALESLSQGSFELARSRVPKMLAEEEFHRSFGDAWFRRLSEAGGEARKRLESHVGAMLPSTLAWLAPDDGPYAELASEGLVRSSEEVRERFDQAFAHLAGAIGIDAGAVEPDRSGWDEMRRRGPGAPAEDAVERARGDRNRALFVE
ncbi:MAG: phenylacetate-CoA oxygenase subunit PaaI [Gemmatimonadota bacterium]|nr:phenylacetate-CoA oxygenase subunit PaaI [Gemmatimonadota bacterium]